MSGVVARERRPLHDDASEQQEDVETNEKRQKSRNWKEF